jgi:hypothetical protein
VQLLQYQSVEFCNLFFQKENLVEGFSFIYAILLLNSEIKINTNRPFSNSRISVSKKWVPTIKNTILKRLIKLQEFLLSRIPKSGKLVDV